MENIFFEKQITAILHNIDNRYWVSDEGTKKNPSYHVWISGITHSVCDSAYDDISLAVARCNYLSETKVEAFYVKSGE